MSNTAEHHIITLRIGLNVWNTVSKTVTIQSNLNQAQFLEAYQAGCALVGIDVQKECFVTSDVTRLTKEQFEKFRAAGFKSLCCDDSGYEYSEAPETDFEGAYDFQFRYDWYADLYLETVSRGNPDFKYTIMPDAVTIGGAGTV